MAMRPRGTIIGAVIFGALALTTPQALHADPAPLQRYIGVGLQGVR